MRMEKMLADACEMYGQELFDFDIYYFKLVLPNLVTFLGKTDQVASIIGFNQVRWKNGLIRLTKKEKKLAAQFAVCTECNSIWWIFYPSPQEEIHFISKSLPPLSP